MTDLIYHYDGTFAGFLCCIYESYVRHESITGIYGEEDTLPLLFTTRTVMSDTIHAQRVYRGIYRHSAYAARLVRLGFLTCLEQREVRLYRLVVRLFQNGPAFLRNLSDEALYPILKAIRNLQGEAQLLRGFVRFSELDGVLGAEIEPKNWVLPLLRGHFCARYQNETLFIYDRTHQEILLYAGGKSSIAPLESFHMAPPDGTEVAYRLLWKRFYDTIAIKERYNPRCRKTNMPQRYWGTMTEFQPPSYFKAKNSCEDVASPASLIGKSAPEIPGESGPSAPGSVP